MLICKLGVDFTQKSAVFLHNTCVSVQGDVTFLRKNLRK
jgi:hypothetical protein